MRVFISYGREDASAAKRLYERLTASGYEVWFDQESLLGGQRWKLEIITAIRSTDAVCAVLSNRSISRRGFINKEIAEALEVMDEMPESKPFLIPVRLEDCQPGHRRLSELHRIDMFPDWEDGFRQILKALKALENSQVPSEGHPVRAFVQARLATSNFTQAIDAIRQLPGVASADATYGSFDVMIIFEAARKADLDNHVDRLFTIPGVKSTSTHLVLSRTPGSDE